MAQTPNISFTFPFRWLKEDREFLKENILRSIGRGINKNPMHDKLQTGLVPAYIVRLNQHAIKPLSYKLTKKEVEDILKSVFPGAKCVDLTKRFVQIESTTSLPVMEMQIFH